MRKQKGHWRITWTMAAVILMIGYCICIFPTVSDLISRIAQETTIGAYSSDITGFSDEEIQELFSKASDYNADIARAQKKKPFAYQGSAATDEEYESMPLPGKSLICSVRIEKIGINIPVYHGTNDNMLQYAAGHLYGTSLPTGGENTHAVIAAHTALTTAKLFTDLDQLQVGDNFEIHVLGRIHVYEIDEINTVMPEEADQHLQIIDGEDLVTLYTCTPYGINTHRLLVRGRRTGDRISEEADGELNLTIRNRKIYCAELAGICLVPLLVIIIAVHKDRKEKEQNVESPEEPFCFDQYKKGD